MYRDSQGDEWASYEDYISYCKQIKDIDDSLEYKQLIEEIINKQNLGNIYIDPNGKCWENELKYKESLERGC